MHLLAFRKEDTALERLKNENIIQNCKQKNEITCSYNGHDKLLLSLVNNLIFFWKAAENVFLKSFGVCSLLNGAIFPTTQTQEKWAEK